jgi:hypothetical protein
MRLVLADQSQAQQEVRRPVGVGILQVTEQFGDDVLPQHLALQRQVDVAQVLAAARQQ